ncbi:MAG: bifunctional sugar-1-phosphate nucleotidylyltransferase/acetyltransferase [Haloarculaceae archaeon]
MQAVILAAGRGTRMQPLSERRPKPMLPVGDRPILAHVAEAAVRAGVDDLVFVVGYEGDQIRQYFGAEFCGVPVAYADQGTREGTADALAAARGHLDGRFAVLNGDNRYAAGDLRALFEHRASVGTTRVPDPTNYGVIELRDGMVDRVVEKPDDPPSDLVNTGAYVFPAAATEWLDVPVSRRGERELTDILSRAIAEVGVVPVEFDRWLDVGRPWELLEANERFLETITRRIDGRVSPIATVSGRVVVAEGATVEAGATVRGPAFLRAGATVRRDATVGQGTVVGPDATVGRGAAVHNSVLMAGTRVGPLAHVEDSLIGRNATLGARTVVDSHGEAGEDVPTTVKGEIVSTGRKSFGLVAGDGAVTGPDTTIDAGATLGAGATVGTDDDLRFD